MSNMTTLENWNTGNIYLHNEIRLLLKYSLHSLLMVLFHLDTMTKENNLTYHIINATDFLVGPPMF